MFFLQVLRITAKKILQVESVKSFYWVKWRVRIFSLNVEIVLCVIQAFANDFHQQTCVCWTENRKISNLVQFHNFLLILIKTYFATSTSSVGGLLSPLNETSFTLSLCKWRKQGIKHENHIVLALFRHWRKHFLKLFSLQVVEFHSALANQRLCSKCRPSFTT